LNGPIERAARFIDANQVSSCFFKNKETRRWRRRRKQRAQC
jgi:hypothetical protein